MNQLELAPSLQVQLHAKLVLLGMGQFQLVIETVPLVQQILDCSQSTVW